MPVIDLNQVPTPHTLQTTTSFNAYLADIEAYIEANDPDIRSKLNDFESDALQKTNEMTARMFVEQDLKFKDALRRICINEAHGDNLDEATKLRANASVNSEIQMSTSDSGISAR